MTIYGPYRAKVVSEHDGDTVTVAMQVSTYAEAGFGVSTSMTTTIVLPCRIFGINAPELSTDAGKAARDYARTLLPDDAPVTVMSHGWDKYGGRFDGDLTLPDGRLFGSAMIDAGHAVYYDGGAR